MSRVLIAKLHRYSGARRFLVTKWLLVCSCYINMHIWQPKHIMTESKQEYCRKCCVCEVTGDILDWIGLDTYKAQYNGLLSCVITRLAGCHKVREFLYCLLSLLLLLWQYKRLDAQSKKNESFGWAANRNQPQHGLKL